MKYYVYDSVKGYEEFNGLDDAVNLFQTMAFESRYTALVITKGVSAIDTVFKHRLNDELALKALSGFLSSSLYEKKTEEVLSKLREIYKKLIIPEQALEDILLKHEVSNKA